MTKYFAGVISNHLLLIGIVVEMGELALYRSTLTFYRVLDLPRYCRDVSPGWQRNVPVDPGTGSLIQRFCAVVQ
jgi:hypothetical protein